MRSSGQRLKRMPRYATETAIGASPVCPFIPLSEDGCADCTIWVEPALMANPYHSSFPMLRFVELPGREEGAAWRPLWRKKSSQGEFPGDLELSVVFIGHAHQSRMRTLGQRSFKRPGCPRQCLHLFRPEAVLGLTPRRCGPAGHITNKARKPGARLSSHPGFSLSRMDEGRRSDDMLHVGPLQMPDEVPFHIRGQQGPLLVRSLGMILAESALAEFIQGPDLVHRPGLAFYR